LESCAGWNGNESEAKVMAIVYVEARPKAYPEGSPINDYVIEDRADHVLVITNTQADAIAWARKMITPRTSLACGISMTRRCRTTGSGLSSFKHSPRVGREGLDLARARGEQEPICDAAASSGTLIIPFDCL
jgi:hypothetical protein